MTANDVILITGCSSGFGRLMAEDLARKGYNVFASMRETTGRNAVASKEINELAERGRAIPAGGGLGRHE